MRLVSVDRAVGHPVARDVGASDSRKMPLLRSGARVTQRYQQALLAAGIKAVWVDDELTDDIEPLELVPSFVREQTAPTVRAALADARHALTHEQPLARESVAGLGAVVERLLSTVHHRPGVSLVLSDLAAADAYTHQHSIDVCALGLLLGRTLFAEYGWEDFRGHRRYDTDDSRLLKLGLGLLLHDIGKLAVPSEILNKPGRLTDAEREIIEAHPEAGAELLAGEEFSPLVRTVVREHHERWDGQGYPRRLGGEQIHQFARIAAVADVYDAVTSERPYKPARPPHVGVAAIREGAGTAFDAQVVEVFSLMVHPFPVGTEVRLADGTIGVVSHVHRDDPDRPRVRFPASVGGARELSIPSAELLAA
jgi:HD-GYP domain-containing protein (c-di-GMP phosphodiesterase class II)